MIFKGGIESLVTDEYFWSEANKILEAAKQKGIMLRVIGSIAFRIHCPKYNYLHDDLGRVLTDIDLISYKKHQQEIPKLIKNLGWKEDTSFGPEIQLATAGNRLILVDSTGKLHMDIFFDKLNFNHEINFKGRLEIDYPTISLVDLLLEKMQIVRINEKDIIDTIMLLMEHEVGKNDEETVNSVYLSKLCGKDWGLWRTVTLNLDKVSKSLDKYEKINQDEKLTVRNRIEQLLESIEREPKSLKWRLRAKIGEKVKWYTEVGEAYYPQAQGQAQLEE